MGMFVKQFKQSLSHYLLQSLMAAAVLLVILAILEIEAHLIVIAAVASSTFVVFAMPESKQAYPRSLIGGHIVGVFSGTICYLLSFWFSFEHDSTQELLLSVFAGAAAVGLVIFL